MAGFTYWLPSLLVVLILKETEAFFDPCGELKLEIDNVKKTNHKNEVLVLQCQEKLKHETQALDVAFRSLKLAEDQFKSKLQQSEGVISSLKTQLEAKEEILKSNNETQIQLQTTIDGLTKALEAQYQKEEEQCGQPKVATPMLHVMFWLQLLLVMLILMRSGSISDYCIKLLDTISRFEQHTLQRIAELEERNIKVEGQNYGLKEQLETKEEVLSFNIEANKQMQTTIDLLTNREEKYNRNIQELREKEKQFQTTIDELTKIEKSYIRTVHRLSKEQKQLQTTIEELTNREEAYNRTVLELREEEKKLQTTLDELTKREEARNRMVDELLEEQEQLQTNIDVLTETVDPDLVCRNLLEGAKSGDVKVAKILCKYENDNCTTDDHFRDTPLIYAALYGHVEVVRVLLEGGANPDRANADQRTALHFAASNGMLEVCLLLLDWGAKVDSVDKWKNTPLHDAAGQEHFSVVKLLVARGADFRLKNNKNLTAMEEARRELFIDVADWLESVSCGNES